MAISTIADLFVATLEQAGVKRIFGIVGDSLNGLTEALRSRRSADDRQSGCLCGFVRAWQSASHQWAFRRASKPRPGAGDCSPNPVSRNRRRLFPGDAPAESVSGM